MCRPSFQTLRLREHSTAQALTEDGKTRPFVVTQLQPLSAQLSLEHPVLLAREFDHPRGSRLSHPTGAATRRCNGITAPIFFYGSSMQF
jgi:hypothetical protein